MARQSARIEAIVTGERELMSRLNALSTDLRRGISEEALIQGAKIIQRSAISKAPGSIAQSIKIEIDTGAQIPMAKIGPDSDHWYAAFTEFGAKRHTIKVKNKKVLSDGTAIFGKEVDHPGVQAKPFLRPAFDENEEAVKRKIHEVITRRLGAR